MPSPDQRIIPFPERARAEPPDTRAAGQELLTFEEALGTVLDPLYRVALRFCRSAEDAEDVVQETALRAFRGFHQLRSHSEFRPWLFTILRRTAMNLRRHQRSQPAFEDVDIEFLPMSAAASSDLVLADVLPKHMQAALESLPEPFQQVIWLVDVEEFTLAEAAAILEIPPGTAASRRSRGHQALREHLRHGIEGAS